MDGHTRRENLRQRLQGAKTPISGAVLAAAFQVSRQVIVQDIALLRAQDVPVISTNRGVSHLGRGVPRASLQGPSRPVTDGRGTQYLR